MVANQGGRLEARSEGEVEEFAGSFADVECAVRGYRCLGTGGSTYVRVRVVGCPGRKYGIESSDGRFTIANQKLALAESRNIMRRQEQQDFRTQRCGLRLPTLKGSELELRRVGEAGSVAKGWFSISFEAGQRRPLFTDTNTRATYAKSVQDDSGSFWHTVPAYR